MATAGRAPSSGGFGGGLMSILQRPETWQWISGVGRGLSQAGRGQGFNIGGANQQLFQAMQDRKQRQQLGGLMDQFGFDPQQRGLMKTLPLQMQQQIAAQQMFGGQGGKDAVWRQKMDQMISMGIDPRAASGIATGRLKLTVDPINGTRMITDMSTGQPWTGGGLPAAPGVPAAPAAPAAPADETFYEMAGETAGAGSAIRSASTAVLGQIPLIGDWFTHPETVADRQEVTAASNSLVRALSVNSRYPVAEQERLRKQIGIEPSMWEGEVTARSRMEGIDRYLGKLLVDERAASVNPDLPADRRRDAFVKIEAIESFVRMMGVPEAGAEPANPWGQGPPPVGFELVAPDGRALRWDGNGWIPING